MRSSAARSTSAFMDPSAPRPLTPAPGWVRLLPALRRSLKLRRAAQHVGAAGARAPQSSARHERRRARGRRAGRGAHAFAHATLLTPLQRNRRKRVFNSFRVGDAVQIMKVSKENEVCAHVRATAT